MASSVRAGGTILEKGENLVLRGLSAEDRSIVAPYIEHVTVARGTTLHEANGRLEWVYFPENAVVSVHDRRGSDRLAEVAVVGREGFVGWAALLGGDRSEHFATVELREGRLARVPADALKECCHASATLTTTLLRFVHVVTVQMSRLIVSQCSDLLGQRLALWILMRHDRVAGDCLPLHHSEVAEALVVRRASVTNCLHVLEGELALRCRRSRLFIRDRRHLEELAGGSYGTVERLYAELFEPFSKSKPDPNGDGGGRSLRVAGDGPESERTALVRAPSARKLA
jgi:CRP-like cAMP-binding protein